VRFAWSANCLAQAANYAMMNLDIEETSGCSRAHRLSRAPEAEAIALADLNLPVNISVSVFRIGSLWAQIARSLC